MFNKFRYKKPQALKLKQEPCGEGIIHCGSASIDIRYLYIHVATLLKILLTSTFVQLNSIKDRAPLALYTGTLVQLQGLFGSIYEER